MRVLHMRRKILLFKSQWLWKCLPVHDCKWPRRLWDNIWNKNIQYSLFYTLKNYILKKNHKWLWNRLNDSYFTSDLCLSFLTKCFFFSNAKTKRCWIYQINHSQKRNTNLMFWLFVTGNWFQSLLSSFLLAINEKK